MGKRGGGIEVKTGGRAKGRGEGREEREKKKSVGRMRKRWKRGRGTREWERGGKQERSCGPKE